MTKAQRKAAVWIKADGFVADGVMPENGKHFSLAELKKFIGGGTVAFTPMPSGHLMICDDNGKLNRLPVNEKASEVWRDEYPREKFPHNNDGIIVGDVLICPSKLLEK